MKLGDKEIEYNPEFRFYITTKLPNPHYSPETCTKTTIVNFAVKEQVCHGPSYLLLVCPRSQRSLKLCLCGLCVQGLEAQLLGTVVRQERPDLEEQKDNLVISIASGRKHLQELEDEILRLNISSLYLQQDHSMCVVTLVWNWIRDEEYGKYPQ